VFEFTQRDKLHKVAMWVVRISSKVRAYGGSDAVPSTTWAVPSSMSKVVLSSAGERVEQQWTLMTAATRDR
jgi:hypothetical protein